jgi:hypothetical protein
VASAYHTPSGTFVALNADGPLGALPNGCPLPHLVDLTVLKILPGSPPSIQFAWCNQMIGFSGPTITARDASGTDAVVWTVGAYMANDMHVFDADTGKELLTHAVTLGSISKYQTPIVAKGRLFIAGNTQLWALTVH